MKNLKLLQSTFYDLFSCIDQEETVVGYTAVDKNIYFGITKSGVLFSVDLFAQSTKFRANLRQHVDFADEDEILSIQFVLELEALCVVSKLGNIVTYKVLTGECESVGVIQEGIRAMSWSPDQELVIFATGARTLLTMTKDFEILVENAVDSTPLKTVTGMNNVITSNQAKDASLVSISWRGDGQMYSVNSVDEADGNHWIRVWERDGTLFSKSEPVQSLSHCLHYRPDGSIIGSSQYLANKKQTNIVFFERNGLQHYDFLLEQGESTIKSMQWNIQSEVLYVHFTPANQTTDVVQLWFRNNYHWYLKQELRFGADNTPTNISWDAEIALRLHIFTANATYCSYEFAWDHHTPSVLSKENPCAMAVIDGPHIRFTPFRYALVPPPMYASSITLPSAVNNISFYGLETTLIQLSDGNIHLFKMGSDTKPPKFGLPPVSLGLLNLSEYESDIKHLRLVTLVSNDTFYGVKPSNATKADTMMRVVFSADELSIINVEEIPYPEKISQMTFHETTQKLFVQSDSGALFEQPIDDFPSELDEAFSQPCQVIAACMFGDAEAVVGLSDRGILSIQGSIAASNCSSFAIHNQFLLFTTWSHKLRLIPLHLSVHDAVELALANPSSKYDESFRDIERGAKIARAVPQDIRIVLQMPRGNLEGIYPKAIILAYLSNLISAHEYREAVVICRKYILDMNIIYDHNPQDFLARAEEFVDKVDTPDYMNLFLSELRDEDITKSKYPGYIRDSSAKVSDDDFSQKINRICLTIRGVLEKKPAKKFITTMLTTYAKSSPPQLEEALSKIRSLREEELIAGRETSLSESALKYLIFLADVNVLYDTALGMYDFDLVLLVAQNSQKDPKEYLPFLANLQKQETHFQRYSINMHLGRFEKALRSIVLAGSEHVELAIDLIKKQKLFRLGLELYQSDAEKVKLIYNAFGDYLQSINEYEEAAFSYMQSGNLEQAQDSFKEAGMYKYAFALCKELKQSDNDIKYLAGDIVSVLSRQGKHQDAAFVTREYLKDDEEAILILVKNLFWDDALRIAQIAKRTDLIETHIKPAVTDAYEEKMEELQDNKDKLSKYFTRLEKLREEKRKLLEEQMKQLNDDEFGEEMPRDIDAFSDTSSVQSGASGYSGVSVLSSSTVSSHYSDRTQRNKKKRHKLRKGSPFEEENLVSRIQSLIPTETTQEDTRRLLEAHLFFNMLSQAKELQSYLQSIIDLAQQNAALYEEPFFLPLVENQKVPEQRTPKKVADIVGNISWKLELLK